MQSADGKGIVMRRAPEDPAPPAHRTKGEREMGDRTEEKLSELLHEAGETHHAVFRITEGADEDWATWYSDWLVSLSELPEVLGAKPVREFSGRG